MVRGQRPWRGLQPLEPARLQQTRCFSRSSRSDAIVGESEFNIHAMYVCISNMGLVLLCWLFYEAIVGGWALSPESECHVKVWLGRAAALGRVALQKLVAVLKDVEQVTFVGARRVWLHGPRPGCSPKMHVLLQFVARGMLIRCYRLVRCRLYDTAKCIRLLLISRERARKAHLRASTTRCARARSHFPDTADPVAYFRSRIRAWHGAPHHDIIGPDQPRRAR